MKTRIDRTLAFLAVACWLGSAASAAARAEGGAQEKILGTWRGTSLCVDRQAAPACNDERVVYEVTAVAGSTDRVSIQADKIVSGERQTMGVLEYRLEKDGSWTSEFQSPRMRSAWRIVVDGDKMTGTDTLLPSNAVVRRMELERKK